MTPHKNVVRCYLYGNTMRKSSTYSQYITSSHAWMSIIIPNSAQLYINRHLFLIHYDYMIATDFLECFHIHRNNGQWQFHDDYVIYSPVVEELTF